MSGQSKTDSEIKDMRCLSPEVTIVKLKDLLQNMSYGIKTQDAVCIELSVRFVTAPVYFHYSGFIRATMARRLKSAPLSAEQQDALRNGIYNIFKSKLFGPEIKELMQLIRAIGFGETETDFLTLLKQANYKKHNPSHEPYQPHNL